jgi:hypothetical protein
MIVDCAAYRDGRFRSSSGTSATRPSCSSWQLRAVSSPAPSVGAAGSDYRLRRSSSTSPAWAATSVTSYALAMRPSGSIR